MSEPDIYSRAPIELDQPREDREADFDEENYTMLMSAAEAAKWEKIKDSMFHRLLQERGFALLIGILVTLVIFYILDIILINTGLKNSGTVSMICELFKYIASTLVGFVFAVKSNNGEMK